MLKLRSILFVFLVVGVMNNTFAQKSGQEIIDSLTAVLAVAKEDTNKVNILYKLGGRSIGSNLGNAIAYGQQASKLSEKIKWTPGMAKAAILLGVAHRRKAEYEPALNYFLKAQKLYESVHDQFGAASCMMNIANVYSDKGNKPKALEYYYKAIEVYEEIGSKDDVSNLLSNIGLIYADDGDEAKALEIYLEALKLKDETGTRAGLGTLLGNIANIYSDKEEYPKAMHYYFRALQVDRETGDRNNEGIVLGNVGHAYVQQGDVILGIRYLREAISLNEEMESQSFLALNLQYLGRAYVALVRNEDRGKKIPLVTDANIVKAAPIPADRTTRLKSAVAFLERGIEISKEIGLADGLQNCYGDISDAHRLLGNYKTSLEYLDSFYVLRDSFYSNDNKVIMAKLATKREEDLKKKQIAINELTMRKKRNEQLYFTTGSGLLFVIIVGLFFSRKTIQKQKNVSEKLLLNILPAEVAKELKKKGESDAKLFDDVTVLFTDFVGFTTVSEKLTPKQLVDELHACFTAFDGIMAKYNIEKIKTVGDAYLAVSGLPLANEKHAENVVRAAIDIREFMLARHNELKDKTFAVRIGVHSGNVVAGIVGVKKFAYDIWGDTVNTAARMEQSSVAGRINVSETTYAIVKDQFEFEYRGEVEAKNKGMMRMYFAV